MKLSIFFRILGVTAAILFPGTAASLTLPAGKTLTVTEAKSLKITKIEVVERGVGIPDDFKTKLNDQLDRKMSKCATGTTPVTMTVRLDNYKDISAGAAILVGDHVQMAALVTFRDASGNLIGEYYNDEHAVGGGLLGMAIMSSKIANFAENLVQGICETVFKVKLPDDPAPETPENYTN